MVRRARRIASICADHGVELPAAALAFPLMHSAVAAVAVGMRSPREVDEDIQHLATDIPAGLWLDLISAGIIPAAAVPPQRDPGATRHPPAAPPGGADATS